MDILVKIMQFVLSFSLMVVIHEFGHFLFARLFGVRVEKFYLFFNPWFSLFKFNYKGTEYGMGWVPFGGYVKIAGMIDESMDTRQMARPPHPDEFRSKPTWQRLLIMLGGVMMNLLLAMVIYIGLSYHYGDRYLDTQDMRYGYVFNDLAQEVGFRNGDRIIAVGDRPIESDYRKLYLAIVTDPSRTVTVERGGRTLDIVIPSSAIEPMLQSPDFLMPRYPFLVGQVVPGAGAAQAGIRAGDTLVGVNGKAMRFFDQYHDVLAANRGKAVEIAVARDSAGRAVRYNLPVQVSPEGMIGASVDLLGVIPIRTKNYSFWEAIPAGVMQAGTRVGEYWKQLKLVFRPNTGAYKSIGGPLAIGSIFPETWNWGAFWEITAFLSIVLAVMNVLPIPALDGGHVVFLLYEMIARRKPSDKFMEYAQLAGIFILLSLMVLATKNDITRFFIE